MDKKFLLAHSIVSVQWTLERGDAGLVGDTDGSGAVNGITYPATVSTATEGSIKEGHPSGLQLYWAFRR